MSNLSDMFLSQDARDMIKFWNRDIEDYIVPALSFERFLVKQYVELGASLRALAKTHKMSTKTIKKILLEQNIKIRSYKESMILMNKVRKNKNIYKINWSTFDAFNQLYEY